MYGLCLESHFRPHAVLVRGVRREIYWTNESSTGRWWATAAGYSTISSRSLEKTTSVWGLTSPLATSAIELKSAGGKGEAF